jgi:hypothetical protein
MLCLSAYGSEDAATASRNKQDVYGTLKDALGLFIVLASLAVLIGLDVGVFYLLQLARKRLMG